MDSTVAVLPNELALVARAAAEPAAFAAIYDHYFPRVYNYVRYRVRKVVIHNETRTELLAAVARLSDRENEALSIAESLE